MAAAMLRRKIAEHLLEWKARPQRMSLVLEGPRQVGKTTAVEAFARANYRNLVEVNFEKDERFKRAFGGSLEVDEIIAELSLVLPDVSLVPGETLLFLDEIQACPRARTALKFFSLDGRYDVVASGSLLGIHYGEVPSFPVGYVDHLSMSSLDFEEYLWARGVGADGIAVLRERYGKAVAVPAAAHERLMALFREYTVVGGMPRAVQTFVDTSSFAEVLRVQRGIVDDYRDDIAKYAQGAEKAKARSCFDSIPHQLARDYKKFSYAVVEPRSGARKYAGSVQWLLDAGIVRSCHNLSRIELPLEGSAVEDEFKLYLHDTGLLVSMLEDGSQAAVIHGDLGIYKGALYENTIAEALAKAGVPLYYFERNSKIEVDFVVRHRSQPCAVEVKASANRRSKSMASALANHGAQRGVRLSTNNISEQGNILTVPLYLAFLFAQDVAAQGGSEGLEPVSLEGLEL